MADLPLRLTFTIGGHRKFVRKASDRVDLARLIGQGVEAGMQAVADFYRRDIRKTARPGWRLVRLPAPFWPIWTGKSMKQLRVGYRPSIKALTVRVDPFPEDDGYIQWIERAYPPIPAPLHRLFALQRREYVKQFEHAANIRMRRARGRQRGRHGHDPAVVENIPIPNVPPRTRS